MPELPATSDVRRTKREAQLAAMPADARALLVRYGTRASSVKVWRWSTDYDQYEYVKLVPASEFTEERIQRHWGGGKYRGDVLDGGNKYLGAIPAFAVAGDPLPIGAHRSAVAATPAPAPDSPGLTRLETIVGGLATTVGGLVEAIRVQAMGGGGQSRMAEFKEMAETMKALAPPPAAPAGAPTSGLSMLNEMLELQERLDARAPKGGSGIDWAPIIKDGVGPLVGVLEKKIDLDREALHRRHRVPVLPAPAAELAAEPAAPLPPLDESMTLESLAAHVPRHARLYLLTCAQRDKNPELYAEVVLDELPGDVTDRLPALLAADDAADRLLAAVPEWAAHRQWFTELVTAIRDSLAAAPDDGGEG